MLCYLFLSIVNAAGWTVVESSPSSPLIIVDFILPGLRLARGWFLVANHVRRRML